MSSAGILVVGYGNDLRGDDAAGRRVAEAVAARALPGVAVRSVQQLVPELAAEMSGRRMVVFVDASATAGAVQVRRLAAAAGSGSLSHHADAGSLLALSALLGRAPEQAWMVAVPARELGIGTGLSPAAVRGVADAVERVVALCARA